MTTTIYIITNKLNDKAYVGQTKDFYHRMHGHKGSKAGDYLHKAIRKHGWENFSMLPICEVEDCLADITEKAYIKFFKTLAPDGYNLSIGGRTNRGHMTTQTKAKLSSSLKERYSSLESKSNLSKGQKRRFESIKNRAKVSEAMKLLWTNDEYRAKMAESRRTSMTEELRQKRSEVMRGKKLSDETKRKMSETHKTKCLSPEVIEQKRKAANERWKKSKLEVKL